MPWIRSTRVRRALPAVAVTSALLAAAAVWLAWPESAAYTTEEQVVTVRSGPGGDEPVDLDTTLYLPTDRGGPVPAVLLAHGFGATKESVRADAEDLAGLGYAVLAYTARGFGRSGGEIHLDSPDYEVRDAQRLLDWLAARAEVSKDADGDPKVGVVGGSYGGGLALMLAAQDQRVDAIVPMITWNDLARSFLPQSTGADPVDGVFKKGWAGVFFGGNCGRFAPEICEMYQRTATAGRATPEAVALLRRSSPATVLDRIKAPTLLIQGESDTLFPLSEADANARGIAANGTPVRVAWFTGGHDGGLGPRSDRDRVRFLTGQWLDHYVKGEGDAPANSFTWSRVAGFDALDQGLVTIGYSVDDYPGISGTATQQVALEGPAQPIANPPGGNPAAISAIPGGGDLAAAASEVGGLVGDLPGQHAIFQSEPLAQAVDIAGAATVSIRAASPTGEAVLFLKLYDVDENGAATLPGGIIAPVRLTGLPTDLAQARAVTVTLPAIVRRVEAGHRLRVVVATSDQGYATPAEPALYAVALGGDGITVPTISGEPIPTTAVLWRWVLAGLIATVLLGLAVVILVVRRKHRRVDSSISAEYAQTPLVVRQLRKEYADGFVAVSNVDFTVERGQVMGLLGPNGAGKTTTLRVLMGLTQPSGGEIYVFGHRLVPGSPVLSRLGALVEGPGFLPHLSGLDNLKAYWGATGRPEADARLDEAIEIAGLGDSIHRKVRKYSHGMKQRLAIAQAMLGLPELLVLDEPTDGLDPPQIAEMRRVLKRYATDGRAVLVSSHLLAEVEQTCTHAVVVNKGEIVASGPVEEIVGDSPTVRLDVSDVAAAEVVLQGLAGVRSVAGDGTNGLVVDINGTARSEVVAELVRAGVGVDRVVPRRRLEDAFLALVGDNSRGSGDR